MLLDLESSSHRRFFGLGRIAVAVRGVLTIWPY